MRLLHSAVLLSPISLPSNRLLSCPDSMWHALVPPQPLCPWLQRHLAGAGAWSGIAAEWKDSQGTHLGGAESQRERLLASRVLLDNTSYGLNHLSKWSSDLLHYKGNILPLVFPCIHLQICHSESSGKKLSVILVGEICQKENWYSFYILYLCSNLTICIEPPEKKEIPPNDNGGKRNG